MEHTGTNSMTKLEAWQAWCAAGGTEQLADQLTLMKSSHGKAFSYAWDAAQRAEQNRVWTQDHWTEYERSIAKQEQQRIVNLLMIQHEMAKGAHNYWHVAAQLIQADVASDT